MWCDAGYQGVHQREENLGREVEWQVAMRPGKRRKLDPESAEALAEKNKASVRAKVEHPFLKVKRIFGYAKVRYRGLAKNTGRLALLFGLGNLLTAGGSTDRLTWAQWAQIRPGAAGGSVQSPQQPRRSQLGGRNIREIGPESRGASAKLPL